jgi:hypothetical protein
VKNLCHGLVGLLLAAGSGAAHSQTAWLLEWRSNQFAVVRAQGQSVRDIVTIRDAMPNYGESRRAVVVVAEGFVHVVDKEAATVASFQLAAQPRFIGDPTQDLSGPHRNMLVTDDHAFIPTMRVYASVPLNELGGQYDIVQMSLADGSLRLIPLPEDCVGPQLAEIGGVPVVYTPDRDKAWRLDSADGRVVGILGTDDVGELRRKEVDGLKGVPGVPRALIRYAPVPAAGVFRLSRLGELDQILDEHLARFGPATGSVALGPAHDVLALKSGTTTASTAIGVVRRQEGKITFTYLDAFSLDVVWASDVTQGAIPLSFYTADDGSVFYIDGATGAVIRLSQRDGGSTSWQLPPRQSDSARILSIDLGR